jgi:hypothetical protein
MSKQTAVEWYNAQLNLYGDMAFNKAISLGQYHIKKQELLQQAKEMEKEQIIDFGYDIAEDLACGKYRDKKAMEERYNEYLTYNEEEEQ